MRRHGYGTKLAKAMASGPFVPLHFDRLLDLLESPMTVASAKTYIHRMREDEAFRRTVNDCEDEAKNWEFIRLQGYEFTLEEFKAAQDEIYAEHGITPL